MAKNELDFGAKNHKRYFFSKTGARYIFFIFDYLNIWSDGGWCPFSSIFHVGKCHFEVRQIMENLRKIPKVRILLRKKIFAKNVKYGLNLTGLCQKNLTFFLQGAVRADTSELELFFTFF